MTAKFSDFPAAGALDGTEVIPGLQGGANVRMTAADIAATAAGGADPGSTQGAAVLPSSLARRA